MKILVNDHAGHPFQIQLSKELTLQGHTVIHAYSASYESPRGNLTTTNNNLSIEPIEFRKFNKYSIYDRIKYEANYAQKVIELIKQHKPDILIFSNNPLNSQDKIQKFCLKNKIKYILWCQDIRSIALTKILESKNRFLGSILGYYFTRIEKRHIKQSDAVINITDDFNKIFIDWGISEEKIHVIPNWAPIDELPMIEKSNAWSIRHGLDDKFCIIYSGTLGLKHNPELLLDLAKSFAGFEDVKIIVITEGFGAKFLDEAGKKNNLNNLVVLPFQDFEEMPMVLGSADVLVAVLEADAGIFSVPSKVLTYLCSGKPLVISVPLENLSSKIVLSSNAGFSTPSGDSKLFVNAVLKLYQQPQLRELMGNNGRTYAETNFTISNICTKFETIFKKVFNKE